MKDLTREDLSSMENLKTQTVKNRYIVALKCVSALPLSYEAGRYSCRDSTIFAESISAALREAAERQTGLCFLGTYDVSVRLADDPDEELYANTLVAPDAYSFLRKCAEDATTHK